MSKQNDPNSIWYTGPLFPNDPTGTRLESVGAVRLIRKSDQPIQAAASLATSGQLRVGAAVVAAAGAALAAKGVLAATAQRRRAPASLAADAPLSRSARPILDQGGTDEIATLHELLGTPEPSKGEGLAAYNRLYAAVRSALKPRDFIDEMDVREIVDAAWVLRQYKSGRAGVLDGAFEDAVSDVLKDTLSEAWIRTNAKRRGAGDAAAHAKMRQALARAGVSEETLRGRVLEDYLDGVERLETLIDKLLDRRTRLLQEIARRRNERDPPE